MKKKCICIFATLLLLATMGTSCKKEPVQAIKIADSKLFIYVEETVTVTPTFIPPNAHNKNVSWESDNPNVATVDNNGNVTGKALGRAEIKVITEDGGRTATCSVTVIQPIEPEEMIWVEGGTFMMGCNDDDDDCLDYELPRHEVTVSGFYISKYVITQKEWVATMGFNPSYSGVFTGDNIPVHFIAWSETQEYISRLNAYTGKNYRLPTEAEWEYAARGGKEGISNNYKYSGSNNADEVAWTTHNCNYIQPVGKLKPNELGIYDMSGNICEYCSGSFGKYPDTPQINPTGYGTDNSRIDRGGCWSNSEFFSRISRRGYGLFPDMPSAVCSFRLVHP